MAQQDDRLALEQCQQVIAALSESLRQMTASLEAARREAEDARQAAAAAERLATARMSESGDRDIAIGSLLSRVETIERVLHLGSTRVAATGEPPAVN